MDIPLKKIYGTTNYTTEYENTRCMYTQYLPRKVPGQTIRIYGETFQLC